MRASIRIIALLFFFALPWLSACDRSVITNRHEINIWSQDPPSVLGDWTMDGAPPKDGNSSIDSLQLVFALGSQIYLEWDEVQPTVELEGILHTVEFYGGSRFGDIEWLSHTDSPVVCDQFVDPDTGDPELFVHCHAVTLQDEEPITAYQNVKGLLMNFTRIIPPEEE